MNGPRWAGRPSHTAQLSLTFIIVLVVAACSSPAAAPASPTDEPTPSPTIAATPEPTPTEEPTATPEPSPTEDPTPGIGSQVQVGDEQYVTVTDIEPWPGNDTQQPGADNVFVSVNIRVDAIDDHVVHVGGLQRRGYRRHQLRRGSAGSIAAPVVPERPHAEHLLRGLRDLRGARRRRR